MQDPFDLAGILFTFRLRKRLNVSNRDISDSDRVEKVEIDYANLDSFFAVERLA